MTGGLSGVNVLALSLWGFLVGFVGWGSCSRLVFPIANWLTGAHGPYFVAMLSRIFVTLFLIFSIFLLLAVVPLFLAVLHSSDKISNSEWRTFFAIPFIGSLCGFFTLGFIHRLENRNDG